MQGRNSHVLPTEVEMLDYKIKTHYLIVKWQMKNENIDILLCMLYPLHFTYFQHALISRASTEIHLTTKRHSHNMGVRQAESS